MLAVSDLALIIFAATDESLAHDGMSPQRTNDISRTGSFGFWRMIGTFWVGAMLYRGFQLCSTGAASKYSSTTCFLRDRRYRPHTRKLLQIRVAFCISRTGRSDWPTVEHTCDHDRPELEELLFPSSSSSFQGGMIEKRPMTLMGRTTDAISDMLLHVQTSKRQSQ
jgi:hypothetical protein